MLNDAMDFNFESYNFRLNKLSNGNLRDAEMVNAFTVSGQYGQSFAP
jgi:hypothetical protein